LQICNARARTQVRERKLRARALEKLRYDRIRIFEITERDGAGRAGLGAGGIDFAVSDRPLFLLGRVLTAPYALHAERAFLHDAFPAHGDVRVDGLLER
jgi:hypothetical protein